MNNQTDQNPITATIPATPQPAASAPVAATASPITDDSNLLGAVLGGLIAALVGAVIWAAITVALKYQIGFMAVGVGFLVAWAVRTLGKGRSNLFGLIGGCFAFFGCLLGNLLSACGFIAADRSEPVLSTTMKVLTNPAIAGDILQATFNGMDVLFYAIAVYEGYKLARRP